MSDGSVYEGMLFNGLDMDTGRLKHRSVSIEDTGNNFMHGSWDLVIHDVSKIEGIFKDSKLTGGKLLFKGGEYSTQWTNSASTVSAFL